MDFNSAPYYDDFEGPNGAKENNYMRILFKPGFAVQARELTQGQTILQNQVKSLADSIYQNGSPISGGQLTFNNKVTSIQIYSVNPATANGSANSSVSLNNFNNQLIINYTPGGTVVKKAQVVAVDDSLATVNCAGALVVKYLTGTEFSNTDQIQAITAADQEIATIISDNTQIIGNNAINMASIVSINDGVFYVDGFFVNVSSQTIVLDSLNTAPSFSVGLEIQEQIVSYATDTGLLDPAQSSFNYQAPGADRYQVALKLAKRTLDSIDTSKFIELLRIENGVITNQIIYPQYSYNEDALAQRTFDQSGDFTVNPFVVTADNNPNDDTTFLLNIEPGKAYIKGYEFETTGKISIVEDKARTTNTFSNYNFSTDYGNYVIVNNIHSGSIGFFESSGLYFSDTFPIADLHCVISANINTLDANAYSNTLIGTTRIREIESRNDGTYLLYLLDTNVTPITGNAQALSTNSSYISLPASGYSTSQDAYVNTSISILAGNCSGDIRTVVAQDSSGNLYVDIPFSEQPDTSTKFSLNFSTKNIKSIVDNPTSFVANVFCTQPLSTKVRASMDIAPIGKNLGSGSTVVSLTNQNTLIFPLPNQNIVQNSVKDIEFYSRKYQNDVTQSGAGTISLGTGTTALGYNEFIFYGDLGQPIDPIIANENIFVAIKSVTGGGFNVGDIIVFDGTDPATSNVATRDSVNPSLITVQLNQSSPFSSGSISAMTVDVMFTVKNGTGSTNANRRSKTFSGNTTVDTIGVWDNSGLNSVNGISNVSVNTSSGIIWFSGNIPGVNSLAGISPGTPVSLFLSDIVSLVKVFDSGDPNVVPSSSNAIDVTDNFSFDSGQRDNYYDFGSLYLKEGYNAPVGQTAVYVTYYQHDTVKGFFDVDSYSISDYSNGQIPVYVSNKVGSYNLRDCIDFRPTRANSATNSVKSFTLSPYCILDPLQSMQITYDYYLPRIDKLTLTRDKQFKILSGTPSLTPVAPPDSDDSMTLYNVNIPAYTTSASEVTLGYVNNRRYTMKDIGSLDQRITNLEYYTVLTNLQQAAINQKITYQDGSTIKDIYGALVDSFTDYSIADTLNPDLDCTISGNTMTAFQSFTPLKFNFISSSGQYSQIQGDKTNFLVYTEEVCVSQNTATTTTPVQPYGFGEFVGTVYLTPSTDYWYSQILEPQIIAPTSTAPASGGGTVVPPVNTVPNVSPGGTVTGNTSPSTPHVGPGPIITPRQSNPAVAVGDPNGTGTTVTKPPVTNAVVAPLTPLLGRSGGPQIK